MNPSSQQAVLIALDGSAESMRALPIARTLASQLHARLEVLHVAADGTPQSLAALEGVRVRALTGDPADAILREVDESGGALLVMTTGGAGRTARDLGSVALRIAATASSPVLLLRPEVGMDPPSTAPPLQRLLVPVDGDTATAAALQPATSLARQLGASLDALFVAAARAPAGVAATRYVDQPQHEWGPWERELKERLVVQTGGASPGAEIAVHMRQGDAGDEIVRFAREGRYDAIVLVRRCRFEPGRAATLRKVLRHASSPVLLVCGE
jgi:nucleotide-binding universal stress UspA family protein